ncbi:UDP-glucuronic acid decarboxylase family protein [Paracoccus sp. T5]|uniref:UDP-glucuronic acid decarboxylase family protein n=1 Tax=Paracoccus sp. T5 TaxID=3402161 RepID=UPI003AD90BB4
MQQMTTFKPTVLVAGGAGFIGSHLCEALLYRGHRVICVDSFLSGLRENVLPLTNHPGFTLIEADVTQPLTIGGPVEQVYNLACAASPPQYQADPVHTMMTNVLGCGNLLDLAEAKGARYLQASTSEVYGDPLAHPQTEDYWGNVNCTGPRACYDEGKRAAETMCFDYLRQGRVDVRVARIFNTYGPQMRPDDGRIISNLICQALQDKPMTVYGDGTQTRSFCYVSDLVRGLMALMNVAETPEGAVNLGNPGEFSILELVDIIRDRLPGVAQPVFMALPTDDPQRRQPDITRARTLLGWQPKVPLDEGLGLTIPWFAAQVQVSPAPVPVRTGRVAASSLAR